MNCKFLLLAITWFMVSCTFNKRRTNKSQVSSNFIDSTDFKYYALDKFDIQDWYDGNVELKTLSKDDAEKYYQHRLRTDAVDSNYYLFYSLQKNQQNLKILTVIDGATGKYPDLRMLIYNKKDSLIGFYPIAGMGRDPDYGLEYRVTSEKIDDTTYRSTRINEFVGEFDSGKVSRDSIVTLFEIGLGHMIEEKIIEKKEYKIK